MKEAPTATGNDSARNDNPKKKKKKKRIPARFRSRMMNPNFGSTKSGWVDSKPAPADDAAEPGPLARKDDEVWIAI